MCSMPTYAASTHRSEYEIAGKRRLTGSRKARAVASPAFSGSAASVLKRMPAPLEPPVPLASSYVPLLCHASRMKIGAREPSSHDGLSMRSLSSRRTAA